MLKNEQLQYFMANFLPPQGNGWGEGSLNSLKITPQKHLCHWSCGSVSKHCHLYQDELKEPSKAMVLSNTESSRELATCRVLNLNKQKVRISLLK